MPARMLTSLLLLGAGSALASPATADELGDQYRRANDAQRTAYVEAVLSQTRFKTESPQRFRALVAMGRTCIDDWDPKLEPKFIDQVASCIVMANRRVKADP
jgi:hypothetical protein